jgi:hypothetical protein
MGRRKGMAASAVSLGLSLTLAVLLLAMTLSADPAPPPDAPPVVPNEPAEVTREPDLAAVFLPPPPEVAKAVMAKVEPPPPVPEPVKAPPEPPAPPAEPVMAEAPAVEVEPPAPEPSVQAAAVPVTRPVAPPVTPLINPAPEPKPAPVEITPEAVREGRALLRLLERGEGPDIEIAWPAAAAARSELYHLFANCFGMRTIVMTDGGEMFGASGDGFDTGAFNSDRYSGFVRQPAGGMSVDEQRHVEAIRRRHGLTRGQALRLFPRRVDAILLGGLQRIAGASFDKGIRIRARYSAVGNGVQVADIQVEGRATDETLVLPYSSQRACRNASSR